MNAKVNKRASSTGRKRGDGRSILLKHALQEFATKGYEGATTASIARAAGMTQPLVHHHFSSKEKLWRAVLDQIHQDYEATILKTVEQAENQSLEEEMRSRLKAFIRFTASHPEFSRIVVFESARGASTYDYLYETYLKPEIDTLLALLENAKQAGLVADIDLNFLSLLITGASVHPFVVPETVRRSTGEDPLDPDTADRYADIVGDVLLAGMRKKP